jgi:hypothetical protein
VIVGHNKDPLSLVRSPNFFRAEYAPRRSITQSSQVVQNVTQPKGNVSLDILEKTQGWLENPNSVCDVRPEVSGVFFAESLSG